MLWVCCLAGTRGHAITATATTEAGKRASNSKGLRTLVFRALQTRRSKKRFTEPGISRTTHTIFARGSCRVPQSRLSEAARSGRHCHRCGHRRALGASCVRRRDGRHLADSRNLCLELESQQTKQAWVQFRAALLPQNRGLHSSVHSGDEAGDDVLPTRCRGDTCGQRVASRRSMDWARQCEGPFDSQYLEICAGYRAVWTSRYMDTGVQ